MEIIYLNENYYGLEGRYAYDIAVIVLSKLVSYSNVVAPICIDWHGRHKVLNGVEGKVNDEFYSNI